MPGRVFTESERRRLDAFPSEIVESDLIRYFTLSGSDLELVRRQRGDHIRLGFALQLCALRYLGFCPLTTAFNTLALVIFLAAGKIFWPEAFLKGLATISGGYGGAWVSQRLPQSWVRIFVIVVGITMTVYFFVRLY